jgi:hypothetical protein
LPQVLLPWREQPCDATAVHAETLQRPQRGALGRWDGLQQRGGNGGGEVGGCRELRQEVPRPAAVYRDYEARPVQRCGDRSLASRLRCAGVLQRGACVSQHAIAHNRCNV